MMDLCIEICKSETEEIKEHLSSNEQIPLLDKTSLGSSRQNRVYLPGTGVSRKHAEIVYKKEDNTYWITDLHSTNGTYLNEERIPPRHPMALAIDDIITISPYTLRVRKLESEREQRTVVHQIPDDSDSDLSRRLIETFVKPATTRKRNIDVFLGKKKHVHHSIRDYPARLVIGRDDGCDIVLSDNSVSRRHAIVEIDQRDESWLSDCGSSNGIFLNGKRLMERLKIEDGYEFEIGNYRLVYHDSNAELIDRFESKVEIAKHDISNEDRLSAKNTGQKWIRLIGFTAYAVITASLALILWFLFR